jgi:transposase-like protein
MNFFEFNKKFPTEEACIQYFIKIRYKDGIKCNHCGSQKYVYRATHNKKCFVCHACKNGFSIFSGTIFEKSDTDLRKWMYAIHLFLNAKKGISAMQLQRVIAVTYKTAWRMLHKIREAMSDDDDDISGGLKGIVECDEVYIGGKAENKHMSKRIVAKGIYEKMVIFGMVERGGSVKALKVNDAKANTLISEINKTIQEGSIVMTDDHKSYHAISNRYNHRRVNHSKSEYVKDGFINTREEGYKTFKIHTNTIEGFWATLKRGVNGIYHHISNKYAQSYINEFAFRYNNRENSNVFDLVLEKSVLM